MRFLLGISCDNAAFEGDEMNQEVARILRTVAERCADITRIDADSGTIRDANGNTVGRWSFIDDGEGE